MTLFGLALAAFVVGATGALLAKKSPRWATHLGAGGAVVGSVPGLVPAVLVLSGRDPGTVELPWSMPGGALSLAIDPLSAFFLVIFHGERDEVAGAGWVYLVATHLGTAFLLVVFAWLARDAGSLDFAD